jgi:hypothetical protein
MRYDTLRQPKELGALLFCGFHERIELISRNGFEGMHDVLLHMERLLECGAFVEHAAQRQQGA